MYQIREYDEFMEFRIEQNADEDEIEFLLDLSFAPGRQGLSSYQLREGVNPVSEICMVCRDGSSLLGSIRYWPVRVGDVPFLLLGPIAVHPIAQGVGIARVLIRKTLARALDLGWARVILIGDAPYYKRFGFKRSLTCDLTFPPPTNPERFLGCELVEGAFNGIIGLVESAIE